MGPGPSDVHPRVLKAMATPLIGHMDPQFIHQEYLTEFHGLKYNLSEHGVFVYPEGAR